MMYSTSYLSTMNKPKSWKKQLGINISQNSDLPEMDVATEDSDKVWRYSWGKHEGEMILCENDVCQIGWFHTQCLKLLLFQRESGFAQGDTKASSWTKHIIIHILYIIQSSRALPVMGIRHSIKFHCVCAIMHAMKLTQFMHIRTCMQGLKQHIKW